MLIMENNTNIITSNTILSPINIPVTFYDGEFELDMGTLEITPSLTFKQFQSLISNKLHISPHQITIYFQNLNNNNLINHHHRRRHPVTSKFDFKSICSSSNNNNNNVSTSYLFWVVQKRSRRTRRRKNNNNNNNDNRSDCGVVDYNHNYNYNYNYNNQNISILKRGELDYGMMKMLEIEKERYLMSMNLNSNVYNDLSFGGYNCNFSDDGGSSSTSSYGFCDVCFSCRGDNNTVPFHWCKNDVVTKVFRSPAGPIARPKKFDFLG